MSSAGTVRVNGREIPIEGERNLLELVRKARIELPTFCYHSELSVYGACRLCMVDVSGRGISPACSTAPENGMSLQTHTDELREMRRIILELLLANHDMECTTCAKSRTCQLLDLSRRLGVKDVRFKALRDRHPIDDSSPSLVRDPNKCVLCGDCVRMCREVQGIGAIDFAHRGARSVVSPAFNRGLGDVECVYCGQCARVCPTGALTPKSEVEAVWKAIGDPEQTVVAQIAPAVRVAIGEVFGLEPGSVATGQIVAALRMIGFDRVYDTSFAADLTIHEEATEFLGRFANRRRLPQFTSCCPAWVKFVETNYPEMIPNLSTCRSPQQMFGSICKEMMSRVDGIPRGRVTVVSIMPCTAKKFEATRPEFAPGGVRDVDHVLTTQELARMIREAGIQFDNLESESMDLPFGFKTGAGVIFGNTGGVAEAVLRFASEKISCRKESSNFEFKQVRGQIGLRDVAVTIDNVTLKLAVVNGLANARAVIERVKAGQADYDLIEVMACPGGCVGGAGQPWSNDPDIRNKRTRGLYENDRSLDVHRSQDNPYVDELYHALLGHPGSSEAHHFLHTSYRDRSKSGECPIASNGASHEHDT